MFLNFHAKTGKKRVTRYKLAASATGTREGGDVSDREARVQREAMLAIGQRPDALIWRQQSGYFRSIDDPQRIVRVGAVGISDAIAVVSVEVTPEMIGKRIGVAVGIEFKTEKGRQSAAQKRWQKAFESRGGLYRIVRSAADIVQLVENVKSGEAWKS